MNDADLDERLEAAQWFWFSYLLEESGLVDVERLSSRVDQVDGTLSYSVRTSTKGRVTLGTTRLADLQAVASSLDAEQMAAYREHVRDAKALGFDLIEPYAEELEAKRRKPLEAIAARKNDRRTRTLELHTQGRSNSYIARTLRISRKTVGRYLAESKTGTDRETPS